MTEYGRLIPTPKHSSYSTKSSSMTNILKQRLLSGPYMVEMAFIEKLDTSKSSPGVAAIKLMIIANSKYYFMHKNSHKIIITL